MSFGDFYRLTMTSEQERANFEETTGNDICDHILWLAYVFDCDPVKDARTGDNGLYTVEWELKRVPGATDAFRAALNPTKKFTHTCTDERVLQYIAKITEFYTRMKLARRALAEDVYALAKVHPDCKARFEVY